VYRLLWSCFAKELTVKLGLVTSSSLRRWSRLWKGTVMFLACDLSITDQFQHPRTPPGHSHLSHWNSQAERCSNFGIFCFRKIYVRLGQFFGWLYMLGGTARGLVRTRYVQAYVKLNVPFCITWRHVRKMVVCSTILNLGTEWSASQHGLFCPKNGSGVHGIGGWVGHRVGLNNFEKRKISYPFRDSIPSCPVRSLAIVQI